MASEKELIARYQEKLGCTEEEARSIIEYDKAVDHSSNGLEYDLSPEQQKVAQTFTKTGTRKTPTAYKFTKRERKPNELKGLIIDEIFKFLSENGEISATEIAILNKERQISFEAGGEKFELTLVQKRKSKN